MSYKFKVIIKTTPPDLRERLRNAPAAVPQAIAREMDKQNQLTIGHIIQARMTGKGPFPAAQGRMGVRTARMRRSLRASKAVVRGGMVSSAIGSNLVYMGVHEFGGQTQPHLIKARNRKSLRFSIGGRTILAGAVKHPGSKFPARQPIYRGITDRVGEIGRALSAAAVQALGGGSATGSSGSSGSAGGGA